MALGFHNSGLSPLPSLMKDNFPLNPCHLPWRAVADLDQITTAEETYSCFYHQVLHWVLSHQFVIHFFLCIKQMKLNFIWDWFSWIKVYQIWLLQYFLYVSNIFSLTLLGHIFIIRRASAVSNKPKMENLREALLLLQLLLCHLYSPYFCFYLHNPK